jgi:CubicO group peptidase (beta-lactamase class C family)
MKRLAILLLMAAALGGCSTLPWWAVLQGRSAITDHRHFHNAEIAPSTEPWPLPVDAQAAPALPDGPNGEPLAQALQRNGTGAFIVLQRGRLVWERYFDGYRRDSLLTSFSVAKSVVALLLGLAIEDGAVRGVDDPVTRYLPELAARDARFAQVRLRDLLEMRSGIAFQEAYRTPWSDASLFYLTPDLRAAVRGLHIDVPSDARWHYSSGDTQLLGMALERATGESLAHYLQRRLWQPMGAEFPASWSQDSAVGGVTKAFCCLNARALDFARLGQLMLQRGRRDERQVVPAAWIDEVLAVREHPGADAATRANLQNPGSPRAAFYTWQWRRVAVAAPGRPLGVEPAADFFAQGLHGQFIYVAPAQQMVIVRLGRDVGEDYWWPRLFGRVARMNPLAP